MIIPFANKVKESNTGSRVRFSQIGLEAMLEQLLKPGEGKKGALGLERQSGKAAKPWRNATLGREFHFRFNNSDTNQWPQKVLDGGRDDGSVFGELSEDRSGGFQ